MLTALIALTSMVLVPVIFVDVAIRMDSIDRAKRPPTL